MLPEGVEDRYRELRRRPKLRAALWAGREAAVVRTAFATGRELWVPVVPLRPRFNEPPPRLVHEPGRRDAHAGLDASGRAVVVRDGYGERRWLLTWDGPRLEIVAFETPDDVTAVTWVDYDDAGRAVRFARVSYAYNKPRIAFEIASCEWEGDRCVRVQRRVNDHGEHWREEVDEAEYDERGLVRIRGNFTWRREYHGIEDDPLPPEEALAVWGEAIAAAAGRVVERAEVGDAAVIKVLPWFRSDAPTLVIVSRSYLAAATARVQAREAIWKAGDAGESRHWFLNEIDAAGLRARRSLIQQHVVEEEQPAAAEALLRRLAAMSWPGGAIPIVYGITSDGWGLAERVLGPRIDALLDSLPATAAPPTVSRAPASAAELAGLLAASGLQPELVEQAAWGLLLTGGGRGRSRLGGRAELPTDMAWPTADGRPLTHLATIDLSELPAIDGADVLPAGGDLVFFADLTEEGELWEPVLAGEDDRVRVLHLALGTPTHEPEPPAVLRRRKVAFRPVLTMPEEPAGLDAAQRLAYDKVRDALLDATPHLWEPGHLLLGHPVAVQGDPREPGEVSLLHLGWDEALGFEHLDGGDLTFHADADDVRAGHWERLTVSPASG